jgi:hypothetical protein
MVGESLLLSLGVSYPAGNAIFAAAVGFNAYGTEKNLHG